MENKDQIEIGKLKKSDARQTSLCSFEAFSLLQKQEQRTEHCKDQFKPMWKIHNSPNPVTIQNKEEDYRHKFAFTI